MNLNMLASPNVYAFKQDLYQHLFSKRRITFKQKIRQGLHCGYSYSNCSKKSNRNASGNLMSVSTPIGLSHCPNENVMSWSPGESAFKSMIDRFVVTHNCPNPYKLYPDEELVNGNGSTLQVLSQDCVMAQNQKSINKQHDFVKSRVRLC